jgi:hypothetical protein
MEVSVNFENGQKRSLYRIQFGCINSAETVEPIDH